MFKLLGFTTGVRFLIFVVSDAPNVVDEGFFTLALSTFVLSSVLFINVDGVAVMWLSLQLACLPTCLLTCPAVSTSVC